MTTTSKAEPVPAAFRDLLDALRAESAALVSNDLVALEAAVERKRQLLLLLAPHARHLGQPADAAAQELAARAAQPGAKRASTRASMPSIRARVTFCDWKVIGAVGTQSGSPGQASGARETMRSRYSVR